MPAPRKQPADRKPKSAEKVFTWKTPDGKTIVIGTEAAKLKAGTMRSLRGMHELDAMFAILEGVCDEANLALIDDLTMAELNTLFTDWQKASGVSLPEA